MNPANKVFSILMMSAAAGSALALEGPGQTWPYAWYPQPVYQAPVVMMPLQWPVAQNPYLPAPSATQPVVPVIPWPFPFVTPSQAQPAVAPQAAPPAAPEAAKPTPVLSDEAVNALARAEADVEAARAAFTLWLPAENALKAAQEAAKEGDSAAVIKHAQLVSELTKLGGEQKNYPTTEAEPELSGDARVALAQAEIDVQVARGGSTLWGPAEGALKSAQQAAMTGDSAAVIKHAQAASELSRLGAEQARYATTERQVEISGEARQALTQAEADVQAAQAAFTLWLPAENALKAAQEAAKTGDSAAVLKHAKAVGELTKLGSGQAGYPSTEREPELTDDARQALTQAEADVQAAQAAFTLWLPAENALKAAQEAAKTGDSAAVLRHAKAVGELTKLGAEQAGYPSTEMPGKATTQKKTKRKPKPKAKKKAAAKKTVTAPKVQAASKPQAGTAQSIQPTSPAPVYAPEVQATVTNPAPAAKQIRPRKLCWQGDRLVECP